MQGAAAGKGDDQGVHGVVAVVFAVFEVEAIVAEQFIDAPEMAQLGRVLALDTDDINAERAQVFMHLAGDVGRVRQLAIDEFVEFQFLA